MGLLIYGVLPDVCTGYPEFEKADSPRLPLSVPLFKGQWCLRVVFILHPLHHCRNMHRKTRHFPWFVWIGFSWTRCNAGLASQNSRAPWWIGLLTLSNSLNAIYTSKSKLICWSKTVRFQYSTLHHTGNVLGLISPFHPINVDLSLDLDQY